MDATTHTDATNTAPTKEEAAAIRAWAKAVRAAEDMLSRACPDSVRFDVLYELNIDHPHSLIGQVRSERKSAQVAVDKLGKSDEEKVDALVTWISGDLRGPAPSID